MVSSSTPAAVVPTAPPAGPMPMLYRLLRGALHRRLERSFGLSIEGREHLPVVGPYVIAANHHNYLDALVLAVAVPHPISFLVMPRVWHLTPLHPWFHRHVGSIRLEVDRPDIRALRSALDALHQGRVVGIFPEGPFSVRGRLEAGRHGAALLALRSRVPVVPAGIHGTYEALVGRRAYVPRRHPLRVRFGAPRRFDEAADGRRGARTRVTTRIMSDIAGLLT